MSKSSKCSTPKKQSKYVEKLKQDIAFGIENERLYKKEIFEFFKLNNTDEYTTHTLNGVIDWTIKTPTETVSIELKSRHNTMKYYPDTMYGINKLKKQLNDLETNAVQRSYTVILFTDCLAFYQITDKTPEEVDLRMGGRTDRGKDERKEYSYIPIPLFTEMRRFYQPTIYDCLV